MINNEIVVWAKKSLTHLGYTILAEPQKVRSMPWSEVAMLQTNRGKIYLKITAELFSQEAELLHFLDSVGIQCIPKVIAINNEKRCFLMEDGGETLRDKLKISYELSLSSQALNTYANLQIKCIPYAPQLLGMGIHDWRIEKLPELYTHFISQEAMLKKDGLTDQDLRNLKNFYPTFVSLCAELASFNIPETLEHGDFQDNNILIQHNKIMLHDFGDATITNPFFSLASFLYSAKRHHGVDQGDLRYTVLYDSYMMPWQISITSENLRAAFNIAKKLGRFVFALSFARIKSCKGIEAFPQYNGYIAEALKMLYQN